MSGRTGTLVVSIVGAAVGYYLGGPFGASLGWAVGSMIGVEAFGPYDTVKGPRLDDMSVQSSAYGRGISKIY